MDPKSTAAVVFKTLIGGMACGVASTLTNPLDVIRIRLQSQAPGVREYTGMVQGIGHVFKYEGARGLSRGLYASWCRELSYSSARIGLYDPIRGFLAPNATSSQDISPLPKFAAALLSGGIGSALCNPCDLIKTRQQKAISASDPAFGQSNLKRHIVELQTCLRTDGVAGLYKGWQATSARAAVLTSAQLGSYDSVKNNIAIKILGLEDGVSLHLATSIIAAVFTTTASNPFDVIKTKYMCDTTGQVAKPHEIQLLYCTHARSPTLTLTLTLMHSPKYSGIVDCVMQTFKKEGPIGFMRGWVPAYTRVSPHTIISLMMIEQFRALAGMKPL